MQFRRYLKTLFLTGKLHHQIALEYRFSYIFRLVRIVMDMSISLLFITIYFSSTKSIHGWSQAEVFLIYALFMVVASTVDLLCGDSLYDLDNLIYKGDLDGYLAKPLDSQFLVCTRTVFPSNFYRYAISIFIIIYAFSRLSISPDLGQILWFVISLISGIIIYYSLLFLASISSIWTTRGETTNILNTLFSINKYPIDIFGKKFLHIFTFLPIVFLVTVPAKVILGRPDILHYFSPLIAVGVFVFARKLWFRAIRHYSSASS